MSEHISTRVNGAMLGKYIGRTVRLTCKTITFQGENAVVEASDGMHIQVRLSHDSNMTDTYVEIIGKVIDANTIAMHACRNMGSNLNMKLVNDTIELIHDPRWHEKMFT